jgi:protein-S-isoprenylcysteine O-methyltransferase Ste14
MRKQTVDHILMVVLAISLVFNIAFMNIKPPGVRELVVVGYVILGIGALLFILSVITLRSKHVDHVIDSGVYGIIRHPMYLGGMIMFLSHAFFGQNLIVIMSTAVAIGCCYLLMLSADQRNIDKFGEEYVRYMKRVPRMNLASSLARLMHKAK